MSQNESSKSKSIEKSVSNPFGWIFLWMVGVFVLFVGAAAFISPVGPSIRNLANWLFALDTSQKTWYITRAAGIVAYLLLWLSTIWGLAISSKLLDRLLHRSFTFDFHQFISLLSLGFLGLHIFILTADQYLPFSLAQIFVPFLSTYRPFWVGIGVIAFYISILVTVTYYIRQKIGLKTFRLIHYASLIGYLGGTLHGIFAGTDSPLPFAMLMYLGTFLMVIFMLVYWLLMVWQSRRPQISVTPVRLMENRYSRK